MLAVRNQEKSVTDPEEGFVVETLSNVTKALADVAMSKNTSRKLKRNYSLNKLSQQEIEELILKEHENEISLAYNDGGERDTKRSRHITPSLEDSLEQDWDAQLEEICSMNSSGHGVSSLENEILSSRLHSSKEYDSMRASKIVYNNTEEELLRSIESDFGDGLCPNNADSESPEPEQPKSSQTIHDPLNELSKEPCLTMDLPPPYSP